MTISVESWRTIANYPERALALFSDLCAAGDVGSVGNALDADIRPLPNRFGNEGDLAVALLSLFDHESEDGRPEEKHALVRRYIQSCDTPRAGLDAMVTLIQKATGAPDAGAQDALFAKLHALAAAGVDPHAQPDADRISPIGFLFRQLSGKDSWVALAAGARILDAVLGDKPLVSLRDQPGIRASSHMQLFLNKQTSFFEEAIVRDYEPIVAWAKARVPADNAQVWLQMGDQVLHILGIAINSKRQAEQKGPWADTNREQEAIQAAYRLIGAGARMRHGQVAWDAVINRPGGYSGEKTFFHIVQGGPTQIPPTGGAVSIIDALIREGGLDVDAVNGSGETMLMLAASACNEPMVEMLLENGANVNVMSRNEQSATAIDYFSARSDLVRARIDGGRVESMLKSAAAKQAIDAVLARKAQP